MGKLYVLLAVGFASTLLISSVAAQYLQAGEAPCPAGGDVASLITQPLFELMLKHRNDPACNASNFYTYEAFIAAATAFDGFGTTGDLDTRKRELAAFFAQTSHETTGWWDGATDGRYAWGYCLKEDGIKLDYCVHSPQWPCAAGKQYYGRGPMKLYFNYNYGPAGKAIGVDLLNNPELVATDPVISFKSAVWYWMTPQPPTKPSCHDAITGAWTPSAADQAAGRVPGFGITTNILVGELECGHGTDQLDVDRVGFYKAFTDILGVSPGDNVDCNYQDPFGWTERPYLEK